MSSKIYFFAIFSLTAMLFLEYSSASGKKKVTGTTMSMSSVITKDSAGIEKNYDIYKKKSVTHEALVEEGGKLYELPKDKDGKTYLKSNGIYANDLDHYSYDSMKNMEIVKIGDKNNLFE